MTDLLTQALKLAQHGWAIHPCLPRQKIPATKHAVKDATTDEQQIRVWWERWPEANIAIACGKPSGVYVVDVDVSAAGDVDGRQSLREFPELPDTVRQDTPRGGFHAFFRTDNPPKNKNAFRPGIDIRGDGYYVIAAPSIHPNGKPYIWTPDRAPWEFELSEFPYFMRPATKAPWEAVPAQSTQPPILPDDDNLRRASLYLQQCDPAVQGNGGHDRLLWASVAMVHGFMLSDKHALDLLIREYNPRCLPPWNLDDPRDRKDFERKVNEARKLVPKEQPGWLLNDAAYAPAPPNVSIDINAIRRNAVPKGPVSEGAYLSQDAELRYLTQPTGLLGELCGWINGISIRRQPFLSLAASLAFLGALFGRKISDHLNNRTNLYCMGVAPSSAGKTKILSCLRRLSAEAGCVGLIGGDGFASDSAIEKRLARQPSTVFLLDEIGHLFTHIKSGANQHTVRIIPTLMKLYSAAGDIYLNREYAEDEKQVQIVEPCCCIYGTSTELRFTAGISEDELEDGWLSRCLVFRTEGRPEKQRIKYSIKTPQSIVQQVLDWHTRKIEVHTEPGDLTGVLQGSTAALLPAPPPKIEVETEPDAECAFVEFDREATRKASQYPRYDAIWMKSEENARKIALIVAASENFDSPCITIANAEYAIRLIRYLITDFCGTLATAITTNSVDSQKQRLLSVIKQAGTSGCKRSELTVRSQWTKKRERQALLDDLIEAEQVVVECQPPRSVGRPAVVYWTTTNYRKHMDQK